MQEINGNIWEQNKLGRWIVVDGGLSPFAIDETTRVINLQTSVKTTEYRKGKPVSKVIRDATTLANSLRQLVDWSNIPPRKHGKFYVAASLLGGQADLDDRFIEVV